MKPSDTYVNPLLTNVYLGYGGQQSFIAGELFPTVEVDKETGTYFVRNKDNLRAPSDARRGMYARANRVANGLSPASFTLEEKSLETAIPERIMRQYDDPFNPKSNAVMLVSEQLKLDKEVDLRDTLLAGLTNNNQSAAWATASTDIVGTVRTAKTSIQVNTGRKANTLVLSKDSYDAILKNTAFIDAVKYTSFPSEASLRNKLAEFFDVERVLVADAINNTAKEGQADSNAFIWSDMALLAYVNPNPVIEDTTAGLELKLRGGAYVDEWYEQDKKLQLVRANDFYDNKIVDAGAMYLFSNTV